MPQYLRQKGTNDVFAIGSSGGAYKVDHDYAIKKKVFPQVQEVNFRIDQKYPLSGPVRNMSTVAPTTGNRNIGPVASGADYASALGQPSAVNDGGTTVIGNTGTSGTSATGDPNYDALLTSLTSYVDELRKRGLAVNPNIEITPDQIAQFTKQAESEMDPYYSTQLKLAREGFLRDQGYSLDQVNQYESNLEKQYGRQVRQVGELAAEKGFAQSGIRQLEEQNLATDTQNLLDVNRQQVGFQAGTQARTFAQKYGGLQDQAFPTTPQIGVTPRVVAGQGAFQKDARQLPFYELSPDVYSGLIGESEFQRRGAIRSRSSELEGAERTRQGLGQSRNLIF